MTGKSKKMTAMMQGETLETAMRSRMQAEEEKSRQMELNQAHRPLGQEVVGDNTKNQYRM